MFSTKKIKAFLREIPASNRLFFFKFHHDYTFILFSGITITYLFVQTKT